MTAAAETKSSRSRRSLAVGFAAGGTVVSAVFLLELLAVLLTHRPALWAGTYPWHLWWASFLAGGIAGTVGTWLSAGRGRPPSSVAGRVAAPLLLAATGIVVLVQVNHHWLPPLARARSLVASGALVLALVLVARWLGPPVSRVLATLLPGAGRVFAAAAGTLVLACGMTFLGPAPARVTAIAPWTPGPGDLAVSEEPGGELELLVVGIDGARWAEIEPLIQAGGMPHLAGLMTRGRRGVLRNPDLEGRPSPVAWSTIMTGRNPEEHGITGWASTSRDRRSKALWEILADRGRRSATVNLPATFPAVMQEGNAALAGDPAPATLRGTGTGWWCTVDPLPAPDRPTPCRAPASAPRGGGRLVLRNPYGLNGILARTSPGLALSALSRAAGESLARRLTFAAPALLVLDVEAPGGATAVALGTPGADGPRIRLAPGEWSPWLSLEAGAGRFRARARLAGLKDGRLEVFWTPFFKEALPGLSDPPGLLAWAEAGGDPYLLGGDASSVGTGDPGLVESHRMALFELARVRAGTGLRLLDAAPWDAWVQVFTLTDRVQHGFWRFREPEKWPPEERPSSQRVRRFGGTIDAAYERVDGWLGQLLERAGTSTLVVVVSDHGAAGASQLPYGHHPDGIYLLAGPTVPAAGGEEMGPVLDQVDFLPLLLSHLGLPGARDLPGRIPEPLLPRAPDGSLLPLPAPVPSFGPRGPEGADGDELDPAVGERLRSLGYLD